jgi:hypothetical protein
VTKIKSTDTRSSEFETEEQKIRFVGRYFRLFSDIESTEFHITYHADPEGDRYDMRAAFLISPLDCDDWLASGDLIEVKIDQVLEWFESILPIDGKWRHESMPEIRQRPDGHGLTVAYRSEGIILKRLREPILPWLAL